MALGLFATAAVLIIVFALAFDFNAYKPEIIAAVRTQLDRDLEIPGDLQLSFFPPLSLQAGRATLRDRDGHAILASIDGVKLRLALGPLLSKRIEVEGVRLSGVSVRLVRGTDGKLNIDDLIPRGASELPNFLLTNMQLDKATLSFRDETSSREIAISDIEASFKPFAPGLTGKMALKGTLAVNRPPLSGALKLAADFTFKAPDELLRLGDVLIDLEAETGGQTKASVHARMETLSMDNGLHGKAFELDATVDNAKGKVAKASISVPALSFQPGAAWELPFRATIEGHSDASRYSLQVDSSLSQKDERNFSLRPLDGQIAVSLGELDISGRLAGDATAGADKVQVELTRLAGDVARRKRTIIEFAGNSRISFSAARDEVVGAYSGSVNGSAARAAVTLPLDAGLATRFSAEVAEFDLEKVFPGQTTTSKTAPDLDLSSLRNLNVAGVITVGTLRRAGVTARNVRIQIE